MLQVDFRKDVSSHVFYSPFAAIGLRPSTLESVLALNIVPPMPQVPHRPERTPPSLDEVKIDPFYEKDLEQMSKARNYLAWQFKLVEPYVFGDVLEVGGGIGNFTTWLAKRSRTVVSIEPNAFCFSRLSRSVQGISNVEVHSCVAEELESKLGKTVRFDAIVCMNVMEHIADDRALCLTFSRLLKHGGNAVIQVPALPFLFGRIDQLLGHYRRYTKSAARDLFTSSGLQPTRLRYFNFPGVWAWWWNAHVTKSVSQSDFQIGVFDRGIVPWLAALEAAIPPPIGQCLLAVGRKATVA
ncbi:hypothetical protein DB347_03060 [Opitutaceae bacterium EW11]|nr:hypothetical protein DB347_03060 [Opitutaceae bacterium EW11]